MRVLIIFLFLSIAFGQEGIWISPTGTDITTCGQQTNPCQTIQFGLDLLANSTTQSTVNLYPGVYNGTKNVNLVFPSDLKSRSVTLRGDSTNTSIINMEGSNQAFDSLFMSEVSFINIQFHNGYTLYSGGAFNITGGTVSFFGCTFFNCTAGAYGGAVSVISSGEVNQVYFDNCTFTGNNGLSGGAIYFHQPIGYLRINTSFFFFNNAAQDGGAIWVNRANIHQSFIRNNTAIGNGGAIYFMNHQGSLSGVYLIDNTARSNGGAVFFDNPVDSYVIIVAGHNTALKGGGVFVQGANRLVFNYSLIENNTALMEGGGIYFSNINSPTAHVNIHASDISDNTASNFGVGSYLANSNVTMTGSFLEDNIDREGRTGDYRIDLFCDQASLDLGFCHECPSLQCSDCYQGNGTCILGQNTHQQELCFVNKNAFGGCSWSLKRPFSSGWIVLLVFEALFVLLSFILLVVSIVNQKVTLVSYKRPE